MNIQNISNMQHSRYFIRVKSWDTFLSREYPFVSAPFGGDVWHPPRSLRKRARVFVRGARLEANISQSSPLGNEKETCAYSSAPLTAIFRQRASYKHARTLTQQPRRMSNITPPNPQKLSKIRAIRNYPNSRLQLNFWSVAYCWCSGCPWDLMICNNSFLLLFNNMVLLLNAYKIVF